VTSRGPQRIVCLTEEPTEVLYALGEESRIVGISGFTVRPPRARREKPKVSAFTSAKIDAILALKPDFVFDARCLPNPHWDPKLRPLSGKDLPVREWLEAKPEVGEFRDDLMHFLDKYLPRFESDGRSYVTICIGCTGGRHRSVYLSERLAEHFRQRYQQVLTYHREME